MDLKRKVDRAEDNVASLGGAQACNSVDLDPPLSSPSISTGKRPMGRDAAKGARKKASSSSGGSSEYASKMHDLLIEKIAFFRESESDRKARLDDIISLDKAKADEARDHRRMMLELERERVAMERKRLQMEEDKKTIEEEERIMAIKLENCTPNQRVYYEAKQDEIIARMNARRGGSSR